MTEFKSADHKSYRPLLFILWGIAVVIYYYSTHPQYLVCETTLAECVNARGVLSMLGTLFFSAQARCAGAIIALYGASVLWFGKRTFHINWPPIYWIAAAYLFGHVALTLLLLSIPDGVIIGDPHIQFLTMQQSILMKWGLIVVGILALSVSAASFGWYILKKFRFEFESLTQRYLFSFGVGLMILSYVCFVLLAIGMFTLSAVLLTGAVLLLICRKELSEWYSIIRSRRFTISLQLTSVWTIALLLTGIVLGYTILDILTPFPYLWDAAYRYANTANLISQSGQFITGVFPYPAEIIMALGKILFQTMMVGMAYFWFLGLAASAVLYERIAKHASRAAGMLGVFALISMPMVYIIMGIHTKVDMVGLFFVLLAVSSFYTWYTKRERRWLLLSALLLGMAVATKLTIMFFAIGVIGALLFVLVRQFRTSFKETLQTTLIFVVFLALPLTPWVAKNLIDAGGKITVHSISQGGKTGPDLGVCSLSDAERYISSGPTITSTATREDIGRYWGYEPRTFISYLALPWIMTMNPSFNSWIVNIGPLMFVFLPLILFLVRRRQSGTVGSPLAPLSVMVIVSFALWTYFGQAITWYALPTLTTYLILVAWMCAERLPGKAWHYALVGVAFLCLIPNVLFRMNVGSDGSRYLYAAGVWSEEDLWYTEPPYFQILADTINADTPTPEEPKRILSLGTLMIYRIEHNDTRLYLDQLLDTTNCILEINHDDYDATTQYLVDHGFKYLIATPDIAASDHTPEKSLIAKARRVTEYIEAMIASGRLSQFMVAVEQLDKVIAYEIR